MRATDTFKASNIAATTAAFTLYGGRYAFGAVATWGGGSAKLQQLGPDGSTFIDFLGSANNAGAEQNYPVNALTANGVLVIDLPPGQYRVTIATASAVYVNIVRVPLEA